MSGVLNVIASYKGAAAAPTGYPTGAAVAFGLRELPGYSWTGALIRVRRASDNQEEDFYQGATEGTFNTTRGGGGTSLQSWSGGNSFIRTYYDQSGNGNNATQTNAGMQNQITNTGGNILTANGKPGTLSYDTNEYVLTSPISASEPFTFFFVGKKTNASDRLMILASRAPYIFASHYSDQYYYLDSNGGTILSNSTSGNTNQQIIIATMNGSTREIETNNTSIASTFSTNVRSLSFGLVFGLADFGNGSTGYIQEFGLYTSDKSADKATIRNTANTYYGAF
jgi:hypothetical protein